MTAAHDARDLPEEDRQVARRIVLDWASDGAKTVGDALDRLEAMPAAERRELLDRTRAEIGLPTTARSTPASASRRMSAVRPSIPACRPATSRAAARCP